LVIFLRNFVAQMMRLIGAHRWLVVAAGAVALAGCGGGGTSTSASSQSAAAISSSASTSPSQPQSTAPAPTAGEATLSWTPPDQNTNGSALTNLAGYRIYYGTSADGLDQVIDIPGVGMTTYVVDNLTAGTYYFSIRAYNSAGVESALSNVVSDTIG
jgi:hypothetical protein